MTKFVFGSGRKLTQPFELFVVEDMKPGTFLVRDSFSSHGDYVLSVRVDVAKNMPAVEHFKIIRNPNDCYYKLDKSKHSEIHGRCLMLLPAINQ